LVFKFQVEIFIFFLCFSKIKDLEDFENRVAKRIHFIEHYKVSKVVPRRIATVVKVKRLRVGIVASELGYTEEEVKRKMEEDAVDDDIHINGLVCLCIEDWQKLNDAVLDDEQDKSYVPEDDEEEGVVVFANNFQ